MKKNLPLVPVYVDIGTGPSDTATVKFEFAGTNNERTWEIKVVQVACKDPNR